MSIDNKVDGSSKFGGFLKGAYVTLSLAALMSLFLLKDINPQGEPEWKTVTTKTQLIKSDSSAFSEFEAGVNIYGNNIEDSTKSYFIITGDAPPSGYIELTFDIYTRMPAPVGVVDVRQGFLPEDYGISVAYPQPVRDRTRVDVAIAERTSAVLSLCDIKGELIYSEPLSLERAVNVVELSGVQDLPPSVYFIYVTGADNSFLLAQKMLRMDENGVYNSQLFKSSSVPVSGNYDFNVVNTKPYVDPSPDRDDGFSKGGSVNGETVSDKIAVQWVVPGFGSDYSLRDLWVWNDITGTYDFQDVIIDTFLLPYPSSNSSIPGVKFDPEGRSTLTIDPSFYNTNPNINFQYNNDAKKE